MTIRIDGVSVHFGGLKALTDVTMEIPAGKVTALIGPNGAGKSTLVNAITGHSRATTGAVSAEGQDLTRWPVHRRASAGIARTFQTPRVKPQETLHDNVIVGAYPRTSDGLFATLLRIPNQRRHEQDAQQAVREALERFGLRDDNSTRAQDLPVWSLRLLEVARAVAAEPRYILLDEPAAGVDQAARDLLGTLVRDLAADGIGVLLIEHNFGFVRQVSDHVVVLNRGTVLVEGDATDIAGHPDVIDIYLGGSHDE